MIKAYIAAAMILVFAPSAALAQRAGDAALGALAGAVVLGPVGAVAGAFVGYSAGPAISRSWGIDGSRSSRHRRQVSRDGARNARAEAVGPGAPSSAAPAERNARVANSRPAPAAAKPSFPPVQTLD